MRHKRVSLEAKCSRETKKGLLYVKRERERRGKKSDTGNERRLGVRD